MKGMRMEFTENGQRVRMTPADPGGRREAQLLVDGKPVRFGTFPDGVHFLYENAYVWSEDLLELGEQLLEVRDHGQAPARRRQIPGRE